MPSAPSSAPAAEEAAGARLRAPMLAASATGCPAFPGRRRAGISSARMLECIATPSPKSDSYSLPATRWLMRTIVGLLAIFLAIEAGVAAPPGEPPAPVTQHLAKATSAGDLWLQSVIWRPVFESVAAD